MDVLSSSDMCVYMCDLCLIKSIAQWSKIKSSGNEKYVNTL